MGGIDPRDEDEPLFATEPFCPILGHVELAADGPVDFLDRAAAFCNDRVWGTLNATLVVPPSAMREPTLAAAVERPIDNLRYGTVAVNQWPAIAFASGSLPWGGHPSASPPAVQSGVGWVHNSSMLEGVEKSVLRGPITTPIIPPWFTNNRHAARMARLLLAIESGRWTPGHPNTVESLSAPEKRPPMW